MQHEVDVSPDGKTVWVNSAVDGSCIGRFSKTFGMDVHRTGTEQMEGKGECIKCTHGAATELQWYEFIALMRYHYSIVIEPNLLTF